MFQNKKLKRKATSAIAEVAKVALCVSNCALPTSDILHFFALCRGQTGGGGGCTAQCSPLNTPLDVHVLMVKAYWSQIETI